MPPQMGMLIRLTFLVYKRETKLMLPVLLLPSTSILIMAWHVWGQRASQASQYTRSTTQRPCHLPSIYPLASRYRTLQRPAKTIACALMGITHIPPATDGPVAHFSCLDVISPYSCGVLLASVNWMVLQHPISATRTSMDLFEQLRRPVISGHHRADP